MLKLLIIGCLAIGVQAFFPNMAQFMQNLGQGMPNMGQGMPNMGQTSPNMGQTSPNMGQMMPNMGQMSPNMGQMSMPMAGMGMAPPTTITIKDNMGRRQMLDLSRFRTNANPLEAICRSAAMIGGHTDQLSDVMGKAISTMATMTGNNIQSMTGGNPKWKCLLQSAVSPAAHFGMSSPIMDVQSAMGMSTIAATTSDYFDTVPEAMNSVFRATGIKLHPCDMIYCGGERGMNPVMLLQSAMNQMRTLRGRMGFGMAPTNRLSALQSLAQRGGPGSSVMSQIFQQVQQASGGAAANNAPNPASTNTMGNSGFNPMAGSFPTANTNPLAANTNTNTNPLTTNTNPLAANTNPLATNSQSTGNSGASASSATNTNTPSASAATSNTGMSADGSSPLSGGWLSGNFPNGGLSAGLPQMGDSSSLGGSPMGSGSPMGGSSPMGSGSPMGGSSPMGSMSPMGAGGLSSMMESYKRQQCDQWKRTPPTGMMAVVAKSLCGSAITNTASPAGPAPGTSAPASTGTAPAATSPTMGASPNTGFGALNSVVNALMTRQALQDGPDFLSQASPFSLAGPSMSNPFSSFGSAPSHQPSFPMNIPGFPFFNIAG